MSHCYRIIHYFSTGSTIEDEKTYAVNIEDQRVLWAENVGFFHIEDLIVLNINFMNLLYRGFRSILSIECRNLSYRGSNSIEYKFSESVI